jgi:hypothetical protein
LQALDRPRAATVFRGHHIVGRVDPRGGRRFFLGGCGTGSAGGNNKALDTARTPARANARPTPCLAAYRGL